MANAMFNQTTQNSLKHIIEQNNTQLDEEPVLIQQSPYVDDNELIEILKTKSHFVKCLSINIQSLNAKIDQLRIYIENLKRNDCEFDAVCIQETWVNDKHSADLLQIDGYRLVLQMCSSTTHGGLAIYIKESFKFEVLSIETSTNKIWEGLFIKVSMSNGQHLTIGNIYRPPKSNNDSYTMFLNEIGDVLKSLKGEVIIGGDFNMDLLELDKKPIFNDFFNIVLSSGYIPKITLPTRFSKTCASLIDNFLCKVSKPTTCGISTHKLSDHQPYFICLDFIKLSTKCTKYMKVTHYNRNNINALKTYLQNKHIANLMTNNEDNDPNSTYNTLDDILQEGLNLHIPTKTVKYNKHKHKNSAWITVGIIVSIKYRDKLHHKLKHTDIDSPMYEFMKATLKTYNKILKKAITEAKKNYYQRKFDIYKNDIKNTWLMIKNILNRSQDKREFPTYMQIGNNRVTDKHVIVEKFNSYFTNTASTLSSKIPPSNSIPKFNEYLKLPCNENFQFRNITAEEVLKIINNLKSKKSFGHDRISSALLKQIKLEVIEPLTIVINHSLDTGIFPERLKIAKVLPVYKKEDETRLENYRPISLLPTFSKIIEKAMYLQIHHHFKTNNLYFTSQYGFRESHSTELAVLEVVDRIVYSMDAGYTPLNVYMDLSKAFDSINHDILIEKLKHYGLSGTSLSLVRNYLSGRTQYVEIGDIQSSLLPIITGVPQGSILGPLFFLIYINDISESSNLFNFINYADDTTLFVTLKYDKLRTPTDTELNNELNSINRWLISNKLSLNTSKTKCMIFHTPQKKVIPPCLKIEGKTIEYVDQFPLLGITIEKNLSWSAHKKYIGKKISKVTFILSKLRHYLTQGTLKSIYNALINSHLNYGILCWGYNGDDIYKLQKRAIRIISHCKYNAHTQPLYKALRILKFPDVLTRKIYKFYYRLGHNCLPKYFSETLMLNKQKNTHSYNTRNELYILPKIKHKFAEYNIRYQLPLELNRNNVNILQKLQTHSEFGFSVYVKTFLLNAYNETCNLQNCYICK